MAVGGTRGRPPTELQPGPRVPAGHWAGAVLLQCPRKRAAPNPAFLPLSPYKSIMLIFSKHNVCVFYYVFFL